MNINIPQSYFSKLMRAVVEFDLIENGDRILIGVSGGKDSIFLTYALAILRDRLKKDFSIAAFTVNPEFDEPLDTGAIADFCKNLDVPYEVVDVDIAGTIAAQDDKSPCFTCAFFRRGAVNRYAVEHNLNKVAYAHHHDDAVETFLMSLFYSGQLNTFRPKTYLERTNLTVIRPLVYFREQELVDAIQYHGFTPLPSPCPHNGNTMRQTIKELIAKLGAENTLLYDHLAAGMREGALGELWPATKTRKEMEKTYRAFMQRA
ncbi:tRNA 2-thiocytidine biosynthesis TtcA family protein [Selenomonas sp. F0473]|uniref:tRNA 2-thiocytidine biosynthesis TtcA family protein n=1 Tax=Selenomonas sp. F0473 TaxID=999423 RepID=UPI00029E4173|nr:tRNA 2-thiocytidine biosynthesis TtcA family protein [Selenomonas sp. F0473]EKU70453.1 hypothetical protein HMPREF9161_01883 [Selenomonas sp. F0473]